MDKISKQSRRAVYGKASQRPGKSLTKAYLLLLLGLHYAYLGRPWMTFLYIGTIGGCGFWFLLDLFRMPYLLDMYYIYLANKVFRQIPEEMRTRETNELDHTG